MEAKQRRIQEREMKNAAKEEEKQCMAHKKELRKIWLQLRKGRKVRVPLKRNGLLMRMTWKKLNSSILKFHKMNVPFLSEKSGAVALVLPGIMAGWYAGRQSDKIVLNLKIFKIIYQIKYSRFCYV